MANLKADVETGEPDTFRYNSPTADLSRFGSSLPIPLATGPEAPGGKLGKANIMSKIDKVLYTGKTHTTGDRDGAARGTEPPFSAA
ncbi:hypothetical protein GCM10011611_25970 [Aliidongia dinghuensis]|uniref:Uncharacterized protein n=1 Tax=Aliidongia dinghuensis TaxID=1867774 RepID=A0A8J3E3G7_9PROT|nr:hypothetical protein GCM10011611_25970 [Aliidongia dinghuensis]